MPVETQGSVMGWVRSVRTQKTHSFIDLDDGSPSPLQVLCSPSQSTHLVTGSSLSISGTLKPGPKSTKELHASQVEQIGGSSGSYPLAKKSHTMEHLRDYPQFRPRTRTIAAAMRLRSAASLSIHQFFAKQGFTNIHTPILTGNDCEGAGELFRVGPEGFFGKPAFLTVSGQLQAEIFACSMGRVYTFGPTFRAEKSHTQRHLAEFWMIEPEMAGFDLAATCDLAENLVRSVTTEMLQTCPIDLDSLGSTNRARLEAFLASSFTRMTYADALKIIPNPKPGESLATEQERFLTVRAM